MMSDESRLLLENQELSLCQNFLYLNGIVYQVAKCSADVVRRIGLSSKIVTSLNNNMKSRRYQQGNESVDV